jgi:predicted AlkP superfamily phosphohydrolase/phosphomutase
VLLVVAWDGAGFGEIEDWLRRGELPHLEALVSRGSLRPLRSTQPPVTFPAWTSFMTGADPSHHGVTDFTVRDGSAYSIRFVNSSWRRVPTVWRRLTDLGKTVGVFGFPATYPPEPLSLQVCGFDTPLGAVGARKAASPPGLAERLQETYGAIGIEGPDQTNIGPGWHDATLAFLEDAVKRRAKIACDLIAEGNFDVFAVHFMESDTVSHHFQQFCDPLSPRHRKAASSNVADAIPRVYRALDEALGTLLEASGSDASVMLVSDHGSAGSGDRVVFWNRWLADRGYLSWKQGSRVQGVMLAGLKRAALSVLPGSVARWLLARLPAGADRLESARRFSGIDWEGTQAFSEELNYNPSIWLNIVGREPQGCLEPCEVDAFVTRLERDLLSMRDPIDGGPVVERVRRREDLYDGPALGAMPDLTLELRKPGGYAYANGPSLGGAESLPVRRLRARELSGAKGTYMSGCHSALGFCVTAIPGQLAATLPEGMIEEAGATLAAMAHPGLASSFQLAPWSDVVATSDAGEAPGSLRADGDEQPPQGYTEAEEAEVRRRLQDLGYLQ